MKLHKFNLVIASLGLAASLSLVACSSHEKDLEGTWTGGMERLSLDQNSLADCQTTTRIVFTPNSDNTSQGSINILSDIVIQDVVPSNDSIVSEYEITVSGTSQISGTYVFEDDDDIIVSLDPQTLNITIDPEAVIFASNVLTDEQKPGIETLSRKSIADRYMRQLRGAVAKLYDKYHKISDITISKDLMSYELDDKDGSMHRVTEN